LGTEIRRAKATNGKGQVCHVRIQKKDARHSILSYRYSITAN